MDRDGKFLRQWKPEGMESVHCLTIGNDGLVYVCNRQNARIQVYDKLGNLKRNIEVPWKPFTMPADGKIKQFGGATVAIDFSPDPEQKYMFVVNQNNSQIEMIERETGKMLRASAMPAAMPANSTSPTASPSTPRATSTSTKPRPPRAQVQDRAVGTSGASPSLRHHRAWPGDPAQVSTAPAALHAERRTAEGEGSESEGATSGVFGSRDDPTLYNRRHRLRRNGRAGVDGVSALAAASRISVMASGVAWGSGLDAVAVERGVGTTAAGPGVAKGGSLVVRAMLRGGA